MTRKLFYIRWIPLLWLTLTIIGYFYPGDEYFLYGWGSILAFQGLFLVRLFGNNNLGHLIPVLFSGVLLCILLAYGMDKYKIKFGRFCIFMFIASAIAFTWVYYATGGSFEKMRYKAGSYLAGIVFSLNIGLTISVIGSLFYVFVRNLKTNIIGIFRGDNNA